LGPATLTTTTTTTCRTSPCDSCSQRAPTCPRRCISLHRVTTTSRQPTGCPSPTYDVLAGTRASRQCSICLLLAPVFPLCAVPSGYVARYICFLFVLCVLLLRCELQLRSCPLWCVSAVAVFPALVSRPAFVLAAPWGGHHFRLPFTPWLSALILCHHVSPHTLRLVVCVWIGCHDIHPRDAGCPSRGT